MQEEFISELLERERMFIWPPPGTALAEIEALLEEEFIEIGASGRTITREKGIAALVQRADHSPKEPWTITDYKLRRLSEEICLATYVLCGWAGYRSRRSTIWKRENENWRAAYHQGTKL